MLVFTKKYQLISTKSNKCFQLLNAGCASLPMGIPVAKPLARAYPKLCEGSCLWNL